MALQEQSIAIKFAGGVLTKPDHKAVPSTQLLALENGTFTKAISIVKRNGYAARSKIVQGTATPLADTKRLASRGNELLSFTKRRCYSYLSQSNTWQDTGACFSAIGTETVAVRTGTQQTMPDHATNQGVTAYAWEDSRGGVYFAAVDSTSGRFLRGPEQLHSLGISPRCVAVGTLIHVYYAVTSLEQIRVSIVNPSIPTAAPTEQILVSDLHGANPVYDAMPTAYNSGAPAVIAWAESATTNVRLGFVHSSGVLGGVVTGLPPVITVAAALTGPLAVAADADASAVGLATWDGTVDVRTYAVSSTIVLGSTYNAYAGTDVRRLALAVTNNGAAYWWAAEEHNAAASKRYTVCGEAVAATSATIRSVGLASRAWIVDGDAFAVFVHDTTYFNTYVTLRLSDYFPAGRHMPALAFGAPTRAHLPSAIISGDAVSIALPYKERLLSENNDKFTESGIVVVRLDYDNDDSHQTSQLGAGLYLAGAVPMHYDGSAWSEQGFHFGPELITSVVAAGGSMTVASSYLYRVWYEWTDALGEIHRGPTSIGTTVTTGGSDTQVTLTIPTLRVTQKSNVRIVVARSSAGSTAELFRVTSSDPSTAGSANGYLANDKTVDTVTLIDRMSDATLATQEPLYTNGGILSNDPCPLGAVIAGGKSRLFFSDPSDGTLVRFSQTLDSGYGVECPPELKVQVDPFGGDVTALSVMDDTVIVFKAGAIYAFAGEGPLATGLGDNSAAFSPPQLITSDVGCSDPASIVLTPAGLMFKSAKGIYLLDRSRSVQYVGAPVELYNSQAVRRATMLPDRTAAIFLTDSGKTLLFDHLFQQWSTFTNHEGLDAVVVDGVYHYLRSDSRVFAETVGSFSDAGVPIRLRFETAWIHMQDFLQGFQMFWHMHLLGERRSAHQLKVQWRLNYSNDWSNPWYLDATGIASQTGWISGDNAPWIGTGADSLLGSVYGDGLYGDGLYGGTAPGIYEWRVHLGYHGKAVQFAFEDFEAAGFAGGSFELSEMVITGGVAAPVNRRISAGRSA